MVRFGIPGWCVLLEKLKDLLEDVGSAEGLTPV
jgi:hypothetical protein